MNRKIMFRGIRVDNGEWIYGDLLKNSVIDPFTYIAKGVGYKVTDPEIGRTIKVLPHTVGQLTNFNDKDGVPIYEGDIVKTVALKDYPDDNYDASDIIFCETTGFTVRSVEVDEPYDTYHHGLSLAWGGWESIEVIGNVYDNHELLEARS